MTDSEQGRYVCVCEFLFYLF